jgi:hypothetical protein
VGEIGQYVMRRLRPSAEARHERDDMVRTQLWLQDAPWVTSRHLRRVLMWLLHPVPRMDTMYVVRAALEQPAAAWSQRAEPAVST